MPNTLFVGKVYYRFDELRSTNDHAAELVAKSKPPEGTVVRADSQTAGRGQYGSRWESAAGKNLTISVILYPTWLEAKTQFYLSMAVALALHDTVHRPPAFDKPSAGEASTVIKWPNDLYIGARKAGGILIQNTLSGQFLQSSVVGIGLNVNQLEFDPSLPNPTSLGLESGAPFDLEAVCDSLLEHLERRYLQLKSGHRADIKAEYEGRLYRLGIPARYARADGTAFTGIIRSVGTDGRLHMEDETGKSTVFDLKEIRFLREED